MPRTDLGPVVIIARSRKRFAQLVTTFLTSCKMTRWSTLSMEPRPTEDEALGLRRARRTSMERRRSDIEVNDDAFLHRLLRSMTNSGLALIALNASLTPLVTHNQSIYFGMPPKKKVDDPKLRRLSEFWVIPVSAAASSQSSSSNPVHISSPNRSRSLSPSKHARASPSKPTMTQSRLARDGGLRIDPPRTPSKKSQQTTLPFATNRTPMVSNSKGRPSASPKFIVIDDDEPGSPPLRQPTQTMSRKRPRDVDAKPTSLTPRPLTASTQGRQVIDLTRTPPPKRRALFKPANPSTPLGPSVTIQQYCTPISSTNDVVPCSVSTNASPLIRVGSPLKVAGMTTSSLPAPYLGTPISRKPDAATLPTPEASSPVSRLDFHTAPLTSSMTIEERTKARLEEIRQRAKAKVQAAGAIERKTIHYVSDNDEDDDLVFNFDPLKMASSKGPNAKQSRFTVRKAGLGFPLSYFHNPLKLLTDLQ